LAAGYVAYWANTQGALRSWRWWTQNFVFLSVWIVIAWPVYEKSITRGVVHTIFAVLALAGACLALRRAARHAAR
jgi:hypothetical protein